MKASLEVLGVTEHYWLDYIDGACEQVDDDDGATKIAKLIESVRPDTVLTFGADARPHTRITSRCISGRSRL